MERDGVTHTPECSADYCVLRPRCQTDRDRAALIVAWNALTKLRREWKPGSRRLASCDPYATAVAALNVIEEALK